MVTHTGAGGADSKGAEDQTVAVLKQEDREEHVKRTKLA